METFIKEKDIDDNSELHLSILEKIYKERGYIVLVFQHEVPLGYNYKSIRFLYNSINIPYTVTAKTDVTDYLEQVRLANIEGNYLAIDTNYHYYKCSID